MLREGLAQWDFVIAAYGVGLLAIGALVLWSLREMWRAEARRDAARRNSNDNSA
ncbi:MAG: hypothetical protein WA954_06315 [Parerythrobacter sp.]